MEAWLKVSKGHCESGHYLESNFSVEIFSAEIFIAEIFTAEPSLRNLHCGSLTAELQRGNCPSLWKPRRTISALEIRSESSQ